MPYIPRSWLLMNWLHIFAHNADDELCQFVYSGALTLSDVEKTASLALCCQDACLYGIFNEGEISGLLTVAKDNGRIAFESPHDKAGDNRSIL